ncbi:MAG: hypothetical protein WBM50_15005 [Acidimicrobiales bacterium]
MRYECEEQARAEGRLESMAPIERVQRFGLVTALAAVGLLSGCVDGSQTDDTARDAAIYQTVIVDLVDRSGVELDPAPDLPLVFVEALGTDEILLPVQADVVASLVDQYHIRFIDHRDEAVEIDLPDLPVRAGSLLIGLWQIDVDDTAEVRGELYVSADEIEGFSYTLAPAADNGWEVVGSPLSIEPEGLVPGS